MWALVSFGKAKISGEMIPDGSVGRPDAPANRASERVCFLVPGEVFDGCLTFDRDEGKFGWVWRIEGGMQFLAWLQRLGAQQRVKLVVGALRRPGGQALWSRGRQDDDDGGGSSGTEVPLQIPVQLGARGDDLKSPRHAPPKSGNATHPGGGSPHRTAWPFQAMAALGGSDMLPRLRGRGRCTLARAI